MSIAFISSYVGSKTEQKQKNWKGDEWEGDFILSLFSATRFISENVLGDLNSGEWGVTIDRV